MEKVKLLATWSCPFVKRAVWALNLKGIEFEIVYEDSASKSPELLKYNPIHKKVPVLLHNGVAICESLVIIEYIDETWKDTSPFLPHETLDKAKARFWAKFGDEQVLPAFYDIYKKQGKEHEEAKEKTLANLKLVEQQLNEKNFFNGENIGFLDLAFGWLADYTHPLEVISDVKVLDEESFPKLCAWRERVLAIPAIKESWPDQETLIAKFREMKESKGH